MIQRRIRVLLSCVLVLALAGCKADQAVHHSSEMDILKATKDARARAASAPLTAEQAAAESDGRAVIACFGDSITAGYGVGPGESYPDDLQRLLDTAGYRYRVVNLGVSGDTTKDGLARVDRVLALHPAVTVVEFGGNDGLRGVPVPSTRANLDNILSTLTHGGTKVVMAGITLPPQFGEQYIHDFNETYTLAAAKYGVPLMPFLYKGVYGVNGSMQQDGIHPTAKGAAQVAKNVLGLIQPLLKH